MTDFYATNDLPSCIVELKLDPTNILELQKEGELDPDATVQFEVVSKDKRCKKTKTKDKGFEYYLTKTVP